MISEILKNATRFASDNSTTILTATGVVGTVSTAVLASKASFKAAEILRAEEASFAHEPIPQPLDNKEKFKLVWREYIPAGVAGVGTVTAIIMANRIGVGRTAAMTAAFTLSERAASEYKSKVVEVMGKQKAQKVQDQVIQERMDATPIPHNMVLITGDKQLVFEYFTARYFQSTMEDLKKAQNDLNYRVIKDGHASLSDFYDLLGIEHTDVSDDLGWTTDEPLDIEYSPVLTPDQKSAIGITYKVHPERGYASAYSPFRS